MFRSWTLALQLLLREQSGAQLQGCAVSEQFKCSEQRRHEEGGLGASGSQQTAVESRKILRLALREKIDNEGAMQPEHQRLFPPGWKRTRLEQVQERNILLQQVDGSSKFINAFKKWPNMLEVLKITTHCSALWTICMGAGTAAKI